MKRQTMVLLLICAALSTGCGSEPKKAEPAPKAETAKPMSEADKLRQKAKIAEAASLIGYDGKDLHKKLDKIIDENEQREKTLRDAGNL